MEPARATLVVALLSFLASSTAANAGLFGSCEGRPGTPTNLTATFSDNHVNLSFINTAHSGGTIYWDIEVRDGAGNPVGLDRAGSDAMSSNQGGSVGINNFTMPPLKPNTTYCFRVRARDEAGTQGCTSQIWGNQACVTTPDLELTKFCTKYADDARNQGTMLQGRGLTGACAATGGFWLATWTDHYNWCMAVRVHPESAGWPDRDRNARDATLRNCPAKPIKHTARAPPAPPPPSPSPPAPTVCAVNALVTVEQCYNLDGTPSQYYTPGSTKAVGCGTSKEEAINAAKASLGTSFSDDPAPGSCTFSEKVFGGVCACSPLRHTRALVRPPFRVPQASCAGDMKPDGAGRCACPSGTSQNGFRCVASAGGQNAGPGDGGTNGVYPSECPPGSLGTPPFCQLNADSDQGQPGAGGATQPQQVAICPPGSFGTPPFCQQGNGGTNGVYPSECPSGSSGTPPFCQQGNGGADGVYSDVCPPGSSGTPPFCSQSASAPAQPSAQCPPGSFGTPPFCTTGNGGTNMSRPGDSQPSRTGPLRPPRRCPAGMFGRPPNCRPFINSNADNQGKRVDRRCPPGSLGRFPFCRRDNSNAGKPNPQTNRSCPKGTYGRPPNCYRPITHGRPNRKTQTNRSCPRGTYGRPPHCYRPSTHRRQSRGAGSGHPPPIVVR